MPTSYRKNSCETPRPPPTKKVTAWRRTMSALPEYSAAPIRFDADMAAVTEEENPHR